MTRGILIEEFHLSLYVPQKLTAREAAAVRRLLIGTRFRARLEQAVREVIRRHPSLSRVRVSLTR